MRYSFIIANLLQQIAIAAVGRVESLLDYNRGMFRTHDYDLLPHQ